MVTRAIRKPKTTLCFLSRNAARSVESCRRSHRTDGDVGPLFMAASSASIRPQMTVRTGVLVAQAKRGLVEVGGGFSGVACGNDSDESACIRHRAGGRAAVTRLAPGSPLRIPRPASRPLFPASKVARRLHEGTEDCSFAPRAIFVRHVRRVRPRILAGAFPRGVFIASRCCAGTRSDAPPRNWEAPPTNSARVSAALRARFYPFFEVFPPSFGSFEPISR